MVPSGLINQADKFIDWHSWPFPEGVKTGSAAITAAGIQHELAAHLMLQSYSRFLPILRAGEPPNFDKRFIASKPGYIKTKTSKSQGFFNGWLTSLELFQRPQDKSKPPTAIITDITNPDYIHQTQLTINVYDFVKQMGASGDLEYAGYDSRTRELSMKFKLGKGHNVFRNEGRFIIVLEATTTMSSFSETLESSADKISHATSSFVRPGYAAPEDEIEKVLNELKLPIDVESQIRNGHFKLFYREKPNEELKPALILTKTPRNIAELKKALLSVKKGLELASLGSKQGEREEFDSTIDISKSVELDDLQFELTETQSSDIEPIIETLLEPDEGQSTFDTEIMPIYSALISKTEIDSVLDCIEKKEKLVKEMQISLESMRGLENSTEFKKLLEKIRQAEESMFHDVLEESKRETLNKLYELPIVGKMITSDWDGLALGVPLSLVATEFLEPINAFDSEQVAKLRTRSKSYFQYLVQELSQENPPSKLYNVISSLSFEDLEQAVPVKSFGIVTPVELVFNLLTNYAYKLPGNSAYGEDYEEQLQWEEIVKKVARLRLSTLAEYHQNLLTKITLAHNNEPQAAAITQTAIEAGAISLAALHERLTPEQQAWVENENNAAIVRRINSELVELGKVKAYMKNDRVHSYINEWITLIASEQRMHHIDYDHNIDHVFEHGYDINSPYGDQSGGPWLMVCMGMVLYGPDQQTFFKTCLMNDGAILKTSFINIPPGRISDGGDGTEYSWNDIVAKQLELNQPVNPDTRVAYLNIKIRQYEAKVELSEDDKVQVSKLYSLCDSEEKRNFPSSLKQCLDTPQLSTVQRAVSFLRGVFFTNGKQVQKSSASTEQKSDDTKTIKP